MVSYDKVLPIGTVVLLKGATARLMIIGYQRKAADDSNDKIYDYCGCPFPEGYLSPEKTAIFDHDTIDRIIFMGLQNPAYIELTDKIRKVIADRETDSKE